LESNWRWNVHQYGLGWGPWRLAARVVGGFDTTLVMNDESSPDIVWTAFVPGGIGTPVFGGPIVLPPGHLPFPYGVTVLPD